MDQSTVSQPASARTGGGAFPLNDAGTFIVNPSGESSDGEMRQRPPVSASEFNHMFSPLTIEQMFKRCPSNGDSSNTRASTSIAGMLWRNNSSGGGGDGSIASAGDTLKMLMSNGSNPADHDDQYHQQQSQLDPQQPHQYQDQYASPMSVSDNASLITPFSPPETVASQASAHDEAQPLSATIGRTSSRPESARPLGIGAPLSHRRSVQLEPRRIPLIPNSPHLRTGSRASMVSLNSLGTQSRHTPVTAHEHTRSGSTQLPMGQNLRMLPNQPTERIVPATANPLQRVVHRPTPMRDTAQADYYSHPLQIHSAIGPGPSSRHQMDPSLRHEVLDKVARRSQPSTPYDGHVPLPSSQRAVSIAQRPNTANEYSYSYGPQPGSDITILPGDDRARGYMWGAGDSPDQHSSYTELRQQRSTGLQTGSSRPSSVSRFGSLRKTDYSGSSQARKTSDGSAHLLTPKDFSAPLPDRIGDMVLNKEIGEWVNINDYTQSSRAGSPDSRGTHGYAQQDSRGPASQRSSISVHSHASAFPLPLPTDKKNGAGPYGIGLISPVENQRKHVHEMTERRPVRRGTVSRDKPIEDEALGSIVQRLMTPATSPEACTILDLTGAGIRNLAGLSQITSRLEAICLAGNKLQSLAGLPTGLVCLRAPSNWIRFSPNDQDRFMFARELPHLEEIDLSANEISDISVFSGLRHLRVLELNRNRIDSLRGLHGCRRLSHLRLRDNFLFSLDLVASESPLLTTLDMFNNRLRVVPASISEFGQLAKVNMVKNDLEKIELFGTAAEGIRELRLSENPLILRHNGGVVDADQWIAKFPNLKTLYLDVCSVRQLSRLGSADDNNMQSVVSADENSGWPSLFNLSLRGNALRPPLAIDFSCVSNMKNLYAPDTQMSLPRTLPPMNYMLQLVICNAGLTQLPVNMGAALPHLRLLDVSNNPDLHDLAPILQLSASLETLKCRSVGFGDAMIGPTPLESSAHDWGSGELETFPDANGAGSSDEQKMLKLLSKLRRLRKLDFRFNKCTADLYATLSSSISGAASVLDGVLSPQVPGTSVMGDGGHVPVTVPTGMARIDEEMWLRQDNAYVLNLKMTRQTETLRRREDYRFAAVRLLPRLEELDGIKVGQH
ncbi:Leucine-rich repeat protein [Coemansia sp. RSA 2526]|nr:Leucine-rich repeat protein [Coemansia sp. RSA 2526]